VKHKHLLALVVPFLLSTSGLATAKGSAQALAGAAGKEAPPATQQQASPAGTKADNRPAKANASATSGTGAPTGSTQDPFSVPLFKDARPLR
jgi:flagellar basal body L-ring protein FlgH